MRLDAAVLRQLRRSLTYRAFTVTCIATSAGVFSAWAAMLQPMFLYRPPGVVTPERVVRFQFDYRRSNPPWGITGKASVPNVVDLGRYVSSLNGTAAFWEKDVILRTEDRTLEVGATLVSANYFRLLGTILRGTDPFLGRTGTTELECVISHALWRTLFADDSSALGARLTIDGKRAVVRGVAPPGFTGTEMRESHIWLPLDRIGDFGRDEEVLQRRDAPWVSAIARLAPGANSSEAALQGERTLREVGGLPRSPPSDHIVRVVPLRNRAPAGGDAETRIRWMIGALGALLLAAGLTNVVSLTLVHAMNQAKANAVRQALGASPQRLMLSFGAEATVLGAVGGVLGVPVAGAIALVAGPTGQYASVRSILSLATTTSIGVLFAFAVIATIHTLTAGRALVNDLRLPHVTVPHWIVASQRRLTAAQVACSFVLVLAAFGILREFREIARLDRGIRPQGLILATIENDDGGPAALELKYDLLGRVAMAIRGVQKVSFASTHPYGNSVYVGITGADSRTEGLLAGVLSVDSSFAAVIGLRVIRGRFFSAADAPDDVRTAVINQALTAALFRDSQPLGACVRINHGPCAYVVGVVANTGRLHPDDLPEPILYRPLRRRRFPGMVGVALIRVDAGTSVRFVGEGLASALPMDIPVAVREMGQLLEPSIRPWRTASRVFTLLALLSVVLICIGMYGVATLSARVRAPELAMRVVLGAAPLALARWLLWSGALVTLSGLVAGGSLALLLLWLEGQWGFTILSHPLDWVEAAAVVVVGGTLAQVRPIVRSAKAQAITS